MRSEILAHSAHFVAVYISERLVLQTIYVLKKEIWAKTAVYNQERFQIKSKFKSRVVSNQERVIVAHIWYINENQP